MAMASTSPPPFSPTFSTTHFSWPSTHSHSSHQPPHHHFAPPSHYPHHHDHSASFDLPDLPELQSSFGLLPGLPPSSSTNLSPPESPDGDTEARSLDSSAAYYPSLSSLSSTSPSSPSPSSSSYSSNPSPTALPLSAHSFSVSTATGGRLNSSSRRRRRQTEDALDDPRQHQLAQVEDQQVDSDCDSIGAVRRQKHRQIDAARRGREQLAMNRLQQLTQQLTNITHFDHQHAAPAKRRRAAAEARKDKVGVLEEAADRMEALYGLINQLGAACATQYDNSRARTYRTKPSSPQDAAHRDSHMLTLLPSRPYPAHPTHLMPGYTQARRVEAQTTHSLYSIFFLSASLPMLTVRCDTGAVLDVNSAVLELSGWQPHHLVGKRITAPYEIIMNYRTNEQLHAAEVEWCGHGGEGTGRVLVEEKDELVPARIQRQYEASNELERRLYAGEVSVIRPVWRHPMRDGRLHEMTATQWCSDWTEVPNGKGGTKRQPTYVVYVISPETLTCVD